MFLPNARLMVAAAALALPTAAGAVTVDLSFSGTRAAGTPSVYEVANNFVLPAGFLNPVLTVTNFFADDRGVLRFNGATVTSGGINIGQGLNGFLTLTPGGANNPFTYAAFNGARNVSVTSGFLVGTNQFNLLVNDTNEGVQGAPLTTGVNISNYNIAASLTYDLGPSNVIPEPATWGMLLLGFALAGTALRRRRETPATA